MNQPDFNTTKINETQNINQLNWAFLTLFLGIPLLIYSNLVGTIINKHNRWNLVL